MVHDLDPASIASQLREHDLRRGSEDGRGEVSLSHSIIIQLSMYWRFGRLQWTRRFSETSSEDPHSPHTATFGGITVPTSDIGGTTLNPQFSFPARPNSSTSSFPSYAYDSTTQDRKQLLSSAFEDDDSTISSLKKSKMFKPFGSSAPNKQQQETIASVWATENLGPTSHPFSLAPRPSIVALPVYPPTSSNSSRSMASKSKKIGAKAAIFTALLSTAATAVYLSLRYKQLLDVERKMPNVFVGGWAFLMLETIVAVMIGKHFFSLFSTEKRSWTDLNLCDE